MDLCSFIKGKYTQKAFLEAFALVCIEQHLKQET